MEVQNAGLIISLAGLLRAGGRRTYVKLRYAPAWIASSTDISRIGGHNAGWDPLPDATWNA